MVFLIDYSKTDKYLASTPQNQNNKESSGRDNSKKADAREKTNETRLQCVVLEVLPKIRKKEKDERKLSVNNKKAKQGLETVI